MHQANHTTIPLFVFLLSDKAAELCFYFLKDFRPRKHKLRKWQPVSQL